MYAKIEDGSKIKKQIYEKMESVMNFTTAYIYFEENV